MRYPLLITLALLPQLTCADEYTVEPKPFEIETTLEAVFLPAQSHAVRIHPEEWTDFIVTKFVEQGGKVKQGDVLVGIETVDLDKAITEAEKSIALDQLKLTQSQHELKQLEITTPRELETHARRERESSEDLDWYTSIGQAKEIEQTKQNVAREEFYLSAAKEELAQLLKMYNEDDKTEETEEIILKRARHHVARSEFSLKAAQINAERQLNTLIPRTLQSKQLTAQEARIANADAKLKLPRALQIKKQEVDKASREQEQNVEKLARLKADRAMMNITAPADGIVYYGEIKDGHWSPAEAAKALKIGGKLPAHATLLTLIPANSALVLYAKAGEKELGRLAPGVTGHASTQSNPYQSIPVSVSTLATHPLTDGTFLTTLKPTLPDGLKVVTGMKANVRIITDQQDQALKIPADYLSKSADGGHTVKLKLADGKHSERKVSVGKSNDESAVITDGLEAGQVIIK